MGILLDLGHRINTLKLDDERFRRFNALEDLGEVPDEYMDRFSEYFEGLKGDQARVDFLVKIYGADDPETAIREFFDKRR